MKNTILFCLLLLLCGWTQAQTKIRVACMGNSITAGEYNYPTALGALLGADYEVKSFGKGGSGVFIEDRYAQDGNYNTVYERTPECQAALNFKPNIVIIKLGTNDAGGFFSCENHFWYTDCGKRIDKPNAAAHFKADYMSLINKVQELSTNPKIYLCYPVHLYPKGMFGQGDYMNTTILTKIHPIIDEIAAEQGFEVIDLHTPTLNMEENFPDGCHPNHQGSYIIAKAVYRGIIGKDFDEKDLTSFVPEPKTPYCIVNKSNGKVVEVALFSGSTYRASTTDFESGNQAQQFIFENFTYDVFRIKTSVKAQNGNPCYLSLTGIVGVQESSNDKNLSIHIAPSENEGYYTMGIWKENAYMAITSASTVIRGDRKQTAVANYGEWSFVKTSDMLTSIQSEENTSYEVKIENGNTISVKNLNPPTKITLYNTLGKADFSTTTGENQISIPASKGVYVLSIDEEKSNETIKIIVQ